jgi:protein-L-isoaspartate O-methyltransferase
MPVGPQDGVQYLVLVEKATSGETTQRTLLPVRFVPLVEGR